MLTPGELSAIAAVLEIRMSPTHPLFLAVLAERDRVTQEAENTGRAALIDATPAPLSDGYDTVTSATQMKTGPAGNRTLTTTTTEESNDG